MQQIVSIGNLSTPKKEGIPRKYHLILTHEAIYLINMNKDFRDLIDDIFFGMGEILGFFGDAVGIIGGVMTSITGEKVSKFISGLTKKISERKLKQAVENLDEFARQGKGVEKISLHDMLEIVAKKGYGINGKSRIELVGTKVKHTFIPKKRSDVQELVEAAEILRIPVMVRKVYF